MTDMTDKTINDELRHIFPASAARTEAEAWGLACREMLGAPPEELPDFLSRQAGRPGFPPYIAELARLEFSWHQLLNTPKPDPATPEDLAINPTLTLLECGWRHLAATAKAPGTGPEPVPGKEFVLVWRHPQSREIHCRPASADDLLALKLVAEGIDPKTAASEGGRPLALVDSALRQAEENGIIIPPLSKIARSFPPSAVAAARHDATVQRAPVFTLQWHITQQCDLSCKHCYDRSRRSPLALAEGLRVLDDLYDFCSAHAVKGQISFTGGNPFLHKDFTELYQQAADRGFMLAILGNPVPPERLDEIIRIRPPEFYQISLEGLEEHNDNIRGRGHFRRSLSFLDLLRDRRIYSMVMLTLTRDNQAQVLPLAEQLRGRADLFTFNRLSLVGEGAALVMADQNGFLDFLGQYRQAMAGNPVMAMKDNFFNLILHAEKEPLRGCCGEFGCGAAFTFMSLLPDGEVHACRKFPSLIGDIGRNSLADIYHAPLAAKYRAAPTACHDCALCPSCRGCLAVVHSLGRDVFSEIDPYCPKRHEQKGPSHDS